MGPFGIEKLHIHLFLSWSLTYLLIMCCLLDPFVVLVRGYAILNLEFCQYCAIFEFKGVVRVFL